MDRSKLRFESFNNPGTDEDGRCDAEGSDVFEKKNGHWTYLGCLYDYLPIDVSGMSDEEFEEAMRIHFVPTKLEGEALKRASEIVVWDE